MYRIIYSFVVSDPMSPWITDVNFACLGNKPRWRLIARDLLLVKFIRKYKAFYSPVITDNEYRRWITIYENQALANDHIQYSILEELSFCVVFCTESSTWFLLQPAEGEINCKTVCENDKMKLSMKMIRRLWKW